GAPREAGGALTGRRHGRAALAAEDDRPLPLGAARRAFGLGTAHTGRLSPASKDAAVGSDKRKARIRSRGSRTGAKFAACFGRGHGRTRECPSRGGRSRTKLGAMCRLPLVPAILAALATAACADPSPGPPLPSGDLGASLDAGRGDALLLSFAAARARASYAVDEGYSLAWDGDDVPAFTTQDAGDFGVALELDGYLYVSDDDYLLPATITHTASDAAVLHLTLDLETTADLWFYAGSSGAATIDVRLVSDAPYPR